ncbi:uncharacterized protein PV09_03204 [Verruconis gallopava]|uniref:AB hydrolase-1 domain-containing protein n=1 Tax=Verruconis gallopava TaxID=253628 RepID=A0A0D2AHL4_9PEZI|nr:uncharacterized protein PV09_03204 [Verruconis gallopava]KIW06025.1 hypothetical protein PV09_03204 [Verruconis gallopava]
MALWTEHSFTFDNGQSKLRYLSSGPENGPLIIFIHGWPGCAETWKPQLQSLSTLGFRVVAPDMRGYGGSTCTKEVTDYRMERHNLDMLALIQHLNRPNAVWVGHDWGAILVWGFAAHYPEKCVAVSNICVPYRTCEFGIEHMISLVNRDVYPEDKLPNGQWDYVVFHNESPEEMVRQLESNPENAMKALYARGHPERVGKPSMTAFTRANGGWFKNGIPDIPLEMTVLNGHPDILEALVRTVTMNGMQGPDDYYRNFELNAEYTKSPKNGGVLSFPVLFIGATYDSILDTTTNAKMVAPMREYCTDLTEVNIDAGHWVGLEKPLETNAALARWLVESVGDYWPGAALVRTLKTRGGSNL